MFSTVIRHPMSSLNSAPVIFVQYLSALAIVSGAKAYAPGYSKMPIRIKWPNDVYALRPEFCSKDKIVDRNAYAKISGILINSSYSGGDFTVISGIGVNVGNALPTTSLDLIAKAAGLKAYNPDVLLASILTQFERLYEKFLRTGWDDEMEQEYYRHWLHRYGINHVNCYHTNPPLAIKS